VSRATTCTCVRGKYGGNRSKKSGRSGASFTSQKNNASATHFFALSPKPIEQFRWERARLSLFRRQHHVPSFIEIHPTFRDLLAKTTFQIVTIIGDPIGAVRSPIGSPTIKNFMKYFKEGILKYFKNFMKFLNISKCIPTRRLCFRSCMYVCVCLCFCVQNVSKTE